MNLVRKADSEQPVRADQPVVEISRAGAREFEHAGESEKVYRRENLQSAFSRNLALQDEGGAQMPTVAASVPILIVDHDVDCASALELMLHAAGQRETRVVHCGDAALAVAAVFEPAVILLEVELADVNGYELAQKLRERARTRQPRLIALTTSREHQDRELARVAGFERYLLKPVTALALSNLLKMPGRAAR